MNRGYVKLWRKSLESGLIRNQTAWQVFCYLLLSATHKKFVKVIDGNSLTLEAGQLVTGRKKLSVELNISEQNVRTALNTLKKCQLITSTPTKKYTVISLTNWDSYQGEYEDPNQQINQQPNQDLTKSQPRPNQELTTKQEQKNIRTKEEIPPLSPQGESGARSSEAVSGSKAGKSTAPTIAQQIAKYTQDARLGGALAAYVEMRKKIKKPLTEHAMTLALKKLDELGGVDVEYKAKVVEQSVLNSWQGLFEIKGEEPRSAAEIREEEEEEIRFQMEQEKNRYVAAIVKKEFGETNMLDLSWKATLRCRELKVMTNEQLRVLCA